MDQSKVSKTTVPMFPITLIGDVDGTAICVPFLTTGDAQHYVEHLVWAITRMHTRMDVKILQLGKQIGEVKSPD